MIEFLTIGLTIALTLLFAIVPASKLPKLVLLVLPLWLLAIFCAWRDVPGGARWKAFAESPAGWLVFVPMLALLRIFRPRN